MSTGNDKHQPAVRGTGSSRKSQREAAASVRNDDEEHSSKPDASRPAEGVDAVLSIEESTGHVILDIVGQILGPIADIVIDAVPDIAETIVDYIDVVSDIVWDITREVIVNIGFDIVLEVILGRETRRALADLGLGELDPGLEGLEALAANPAARELFAKRMIEARKQGKAFPLPSARELIEYRDRYLKRVIEQGK